MVKSVRLHVLMFLGLSVTIRSFVITYSTPQQCGDVEIAWTKPSTSAAQLTFPLQLHIVPFDSIAISQQIRGWNASMTSGSAVVNLMFNLTSGTDFLLGITDDTGKGVGPVSDVKTVAPSQDTSCLSTSTSTLSPGQFQVLTTSTNSSECPSINVEWDGTVKSPRPTILGFSPGQHPVDMDPQSFPVPTERIVQSTGTFTSMSKVVVLFRDSDSIGRTSQFLTVGGMDKTDCSSPLESEIGTWANSSVACTVDSTSLNLKGAGKVLGGTGAAVVGLAAVLFVVFAIRRRFGRSAGGPGSQEAGASPQQPDPHDRGPVSPSIAPKSASSEIHHTGEDDKQAHDPEKEAPTTPTSDDLAHVTSLPILPDTPLSRRRSWTSRASQASQITRSQPSMTTDESTFLKFATASILPSPSHTDTDKADPVELVQTQGYDHAASLPDSPTLPDTRALKSPRLIRIPGLPATPKSHSAQSQRSQRSEKRENYLKLSPGFEDTLPGGDLGEKPQSPRTPSSWRSHASLASRATRTQKSE